MVKVSTSTLKNQEIDKTLLQACESLSDLLAKGLKPGLALWKVSDVYGISADSIKRAYRAKVEDEFWGPVGSGD